jgi:hypothetical protein
MARHSYAYLVVAEAPAATSAEAAAKRFSDGAGMLFESEKEMLS